jgi:hypothetical protein
MVSIQHVIVLDIVDMHLRIGVLSWKCTAILRITVAANASGIEVQVISNYDVLHPLQVIWPHANQTLQQFLF